MRLFQTAGHFELFSELTRVAQSAANKMRAKSGLIQTKAPTHKGLALNKVTDIFKISLRRYKLPSVTRETGNTKRTR